LFFYEASSQKNHQHIFGAHDFGRFFNTSLNQEQKYTDKSSALILHILGANDFIS